MGMEVETINSSMVNSQLLGLWIFFFLFFAGIYLWKQLNYMLMNKSQFID